MAIKKTTPKPAEAVVVAAPEVEIELPEIDESEASPDQLRIKELLERVAVATDLNKNKVRAIAEATLNELGKALAAGEGVNLPQLGKIRIVNTRTEEQGMILTLKLRRMNMSADAASAEKQPLAAVDEES